MAIAELRKRPVIMPQFIAVRSPYGVQADEQGLPQTPLLLFSRTEYSPSILAAPSSPVEQVLREAGIELSDFVRGNEKRVSE